MLRSVFYDCRLRMMCRCVFAFALVCALTCVLACLDRRKGGDEGRRGSECRSEKCFIEWERDWRLRGAKEEMIRRTGVEEEEKHGEEEYRGEGRWTEWVIVTYSPCHSLGVVHFYTVETQSNCSQKSLVIYAYNDIAVIGLDKRYRLAFQHPEWVWGQRGKEGRAQGIFLYAQPMWGWAERSGERRQLLHTYWWRGKCAKER